MGPFETFYQSPLQHPWLLWAAALAGTAFAVSRPGLDPSLRRFCLALGALSLADAWLSAHHAYGFGVLQDRVRSGLQLFFVLAGDFRFLLLLGAATPDRRFAIGAGGVGRALGLTLLVPITSQLVMVLLPGEPGARVLFLVYELLFFALTLVLLARHPGPQRARWLRPVCHFVLLYYGLWATADAVILATGLDVGYGLRVVPNLLYYGGLIAAIGWAGAER